MKYGRRRRRKSSYNRRKSSDVIVVTDPEGGKNTTTEAAEKGETLDEAVNETVNEAVNENGNEDVVEDVTAENVTVENVTAETETETETVNKTEEAVNEAVNENLTEENVTAETEESVEAGAERERDESEDSAQHSAQMNALGDAQKKDDPIHGPDDEEESPPQTPDGVAGVLNIYPVGGDSGVINITPLEGTTEGRNSEERINPPAEHTATTEDGTTIDTSNGLNSRETTFQKLRERIMMNKLQKRYHGDWRENTNPIRPSLYRKYPKRKSSRIRERAFGVVPVAEPDELGKKLCETVVQPEVKNTALDSIQNNVEGKEDYQRYYLQPMGPIDPMPLGMTIKEEPMEEKQTLEEPRREEVEQPTGSHVGGSGFIQDGGAVIEYKGVKRNLVPEFDEETNKKSNEEERIWLRALKEQGVNEVKRNENIAGISQQYQNEYYKFIEGKDFSKEAKQAYGSGSNTQVEKYKAKSAEKLPEIKPIVHGGGGVAASGGVQEEIQKNTAKEAFELTDFCSSLMARHPLYLQPCEGQGQPQGHGQVQVQGQTTPGSSGGQVMFVPKLVPYPNLIPQGHCQCDGRAQGQPCKGKCKMIPAMMNPMVGGGGVSIPEATPIVSPFPNPPYQLIGNSMGNLQKTGSLHHVVENPSEQLTSNISRRKQNAPKKRRKLTDDADDNETEAVTMETNITSPELNTGSGNKMANKSEGNTSLGNSAPSGGKVTEEGTEEKDVTYAYIAIPVSAFVPNQPGMPGVQGIPGVSPVGIPQGVTCMSGVQRIPGVSPAGIPQAMPGSPQVTQETPLGVPGVPQCVPESPQAIPGIHGVPQPPVLPPPAQPVVTPCIARVSTGSLGSKVSDIQSFYPNQVQNQALDFSIRSRIEEEREPGEVVPVNRGQGQIKGHSKGHRPVVPVQPFPVPVSPFPVGSVPMNPFSRDSGQERESTQDGANTRRSGHMIRNIRQGVAHVHQGNYTPPISGERNRSEVTRGQIRHDSQGHLQVQGRTLHQQQKHSFPELGHAAPTHGNSATKKLKTAHPRDPRNFSHFACLPQIYQTESSPGGHARPQHNVFASSSGGGPVDGNLSLPKPDIRYREPPFVPMHLPVMSAQAQRQYLVPSHKDLNAADWSRSKSHGHLQPNLAHAQLDLQQIQNQRASFSKPERGMRAQSQFIDLTDDADDVEDVYSPGNDDVTNASQITSQITSQIPAPLKRHHQDVTIPPNDSQTIQEEQIRLMDNVSKLAELHSEVGALLNESTHILDTLTPGEAETPEVKKAKRKKGKTGRKLIKYDAKGRRIFKFHEYCPR